ncbi:hypothetical protein [Streptomyces sp. NPDC014733]|uniref:hypothetical protein n=1 Tax=Streptomyces sp. NPDC014733 TaxID=3364885 RepID=UPI0036FC4EE4
MPDTAVELRPGLAFDRGCLLWGRCVVEAPLLEEGLCDVEGVLGFGAVEAFAICEFGDQAVVEQCLQLAQGCCSSLSGRLEAVCAVSGLVSLAGVVEAGLLVGGSALREAAVQVALFSEASFEFGGQLLVRALMLAYLLAVTMACLVGGPLVVGGASAQPFGLVFGGGFAAEASCCGLGGELGVQGGVAPAAERGDERLQAVAVALKGLGFHWESGEGVVRCGAQAGGGCA